MTVENDNTPSISERLKKELLEDDKLLANSVVDLDSDDDEEEDNDDEEEDEEDE